MKGSLKRSGLKLQGPLYYIYWPPQLGNVTKIPILRYQEQASVNAKYHKSLVKPIINVMK